jgi:sugar lactone lactonase YvrE
MKSQNHLAVLSLIIVLVLLAVCPAWAAVAPQVSTLTPIRQGLKAPVRVITDQAGYLYVADPRAGGVVKLSQDGQPALPSSLIRTAAPPLGIALNARGDLLVTQGTVVAVYTKQSDYSYTRTSQFQPGATAVTPLLNGIAIAADGSVFVTDSANNTVHIFNASYGYVRSFGSKGAQLGAFNLPTAIAYEQASNQLAVVDTLNGRIQFFTTAGVYQRHIGTLGADPNANDTVTDPTIYFTAPQGIAFEYTRTTPPLLNRMYVADSYQSRVQVIDPSGSGARLRYIGNHGLAKGTLVAPGDVAFDALNSRILVANGFGNLMPFGIDGGVDPNPDTPPTLKLNLPPTIIRTDSFTLSGTVDKPAIISVASTPDLSVANGTFSTVTAWSTPVTGLTAGQLVTFTVSAKSLGGTTTTSAPFTVTFQPTAPELTVNPFTAVTAASAITITGTKDATGTITGSSAGAATVSNIQQTATTWTATLGNLQPGVNTFTMTASASVSNTTSLTITVEKIALVASHLPTGSTVTNPVQNITGIVNGVDTVTVTLNGGTPLTVPVLNSVYSTAVNLRNGANTIVISATDSTSATTTVTDQLTFDPSAPMVTIDAMTYNPGFGAIAVQDGGVVPTNTQLILTVSADPGTVAVTVNGTAATDNGNGTWTTASLATAGQVTIVATVTNSNNKSSSVKRSILVTSVATVPLLTVSIADDPSTPATVYVADSLTNIGTLYLSGTAPSAVAVSVTVNGTPAPVSLNTTATPATFVVSLPIELATEGTATIVITAYGPNGTTSSVTRTLIYSLTPPQATATTSAGTVTITAGNGLQQAYTLNGSGTRVPVTIPAPNPNGTTTFTYPVNDPALATLTFVDAAGNTSRSGRLLGGTGEPTIADVVRALQIAVSGIQPTVDDKLRGDVAPLTNQRTLPNGVFQYDATPDGKIDIDDVRVILYRLVGVITW